MELDLNFADLSLTGLFTYLLLLTFVDVGVNVLLSVKNGNFSGIYVADFIRTHILLRVFAIGSLGVLGHGVPAFDVPAIPIVSVAATVALAAYAIETVASLKEAATKGTVPVPQPPTPTPEG